MKNKELQEILRQYPDEATIITSFVDKNNDVHVKTNVEITYYKKNHVTPYIDIEIKD